MIERDVTEDSENPDKTTLVLADKTFIIDTEVSPNQLKESTFTSILALIAAAVSTFTNKRITKRVVAVTVSATPAINVDNGDVFTITSQSAAITSMTTNLTGTPTSAQQMIIEILDNGTARAITWGASFASGPATLPTTTILSKWLYVGFEWSASRSKWICMAAGSEQ